MSRTMQTFVVAPAGRMAEVLAFIAARSKAHVTATQYGGSIKLECGFDSSCDPLLHALNRKFGDMQEGCLRQCDMPSEWVKK